MCGAISKLQRKFVYAAMTYPGSDDTKLQLLSHIPEGDFTSSQSKVWSHRLSIVSPSPMSRPNIV